MRTAKISAASTVAGILRSYLSAGRIHAADNRPSHAPRSATGDVAVSPRRPHGRLGAGDRVGPAEFQRCRIETLQAPRLGERGKDAVADGVALLRNSLGESAESRLTPGNGELCGGTA
jgi:hypothetical protein